MKWIKYLIQQYPYRGLFGWATICVWSFFIAEILWHLSAFVRRYDVIEIGMIVPYAPLAFILDPHDAMLHHPHVFFVALANWLGIFVLGALLSLKRCSATLSGVSTLLMLLPLAIIRALWAWVLFPPGPVE